VDTKESRILAALDLAVGADGIRPKIDAIVARVEQKLRDSPSDGLAWEAIPLDLFTTSLPETIRSSWVFILRANTASGAERHPNSHQRMMSYRGSGDFQTRPGRDWCSHLLESDPTAPIARRWISIPPNVWHQGVVRDSNWVVVSFQTAAEHELIEERPVEKGEEGEDGANGKEAVRQRRYAEKR
jgi:hypothetical protein